MATSGGPIVKNVLPAGRGAGRGGGRGIEDGQDEVEEEMALQEGSRKEEEGGGVTRFGTRFDADAGDLPESQCERLATGSSCRCCGVGARDSWTTRLPAWTRSSRTLLGCRCAASRNVHASLGDFWMGSTAPSRNHPGLKHVKS